MSRHRKPTRAEVSQVFQDAFERIGDVERLAIWADANPTEFYKLYGRLLPASSHPELDSDNEVVIRHVIAVKPLGGAPALHYDETE